MSNNIFKLIFCSLVIFFSSTSIVSADELSVRVDSPKGGAQYISPVEFDGAFKVELGTGSISCPLLGNISLIQYWYDSPSGPTGSGVGTAKFSTYLYAPSGVWNPFNVDGTNGVINKKTNLSFGQHTLYWRFISLPGFPWSSGQTCQGSINSITFNVVDPALVPSISFLINGAPQNFNINVPSDTFSYNVSAGNNPEKCYVYWENELSSSWVWRQLTSCNFGNSGIGINSSPGLFMGVPLEDGENRIYVKSWNSTGGFSQTAERRINVQSNLPRVSLVLQSSPTNFGDTAQVSWDVSNSVSCTPSSNPTQSWWNSVIVPMFFGGWSNNSGSPITTPPVTFTYELRLSCSNPYGTATAILPIIPLMPGYCGDGFVDSLGNYEQCDLGAQNGVIGSGCDNSCNLTIPMDFSFTIDRNNLSTTESTFTRARLINSGIAGMDNVDCVASNSASDSSWQGSINIGTSAITSTNVGPFIEGQHQLVLECSNGVNSLSKSITITSYDNENGVCGIDDGRILSNVPVNLCDSGQPGPVTFDNNFQNWQWQCLATGGAVGNSSCSATLAQNPTIDSVDINSNSIIADNNQQYTVTIRATDPLGANNISDMYSRINFQGTNAGAHRGYFGWSNNNFASWGAGNFASSPIDCNLGKAAIYSGFGSNYIRLISCDTSVSGNTRVSNIVLAFNSIYSTPLTNNTLSGWMRNINGVTDGWRDFDTFDLSSGNTNGQCGSADGKKRFTKPTGSVLCNAGNATSVNGAGPWTWQCRGTGGGTDSRVCRADKYRIGFTESN